MNQLTEEDEDTLFDELKEVAHINEQDKSIVVFASPSETSALGIHLVQTVGGWLLDRRRARLNARAAASSNGGQTLFSPNPDSNMATN
jgi:hypothetical protein